MELIDRYVHAVIRRLPASQRGDIEKELRSLIEDMRAARTGTQAGDPSAIVRDILLELGPPDVMARNYRGEARCLVGPALYETYWLVVKIVALSIAGALTLATAIRLALDPPSNLAETLLLFPASVVSAVVGAFGWITLVFAILQHKGVDVSTGTEKEAKEWNPDDLPPVPTAAARIRLGDSIPGLVFGILFLILLNTSSHLLGVYFFDLSGRNFVPLLDPDRFAVWLPWLNLVVALGILKEGLKLALGRWTLWLAAFNAALNVGTLVLFVSLVQDPALVSAAFWTEMADRVGDAVGELRRVEPLLRGLAIVGVGIGCGIDTVATGIKAIRGYLERATGGAYPGGTAG